VRVELSAKAVEDIGQIGDYIAIDNRAAAKRYVEEIERRCRNLRRMPERFPIAFNLTPPVRQRVLGRHYIFYSVRRDYVLIERVLDSARDISSTMFSR